MNITHPKSAQSILLTVENAMLCDALERVGTVIKLSDWPSWPAVATPDSESIRVLVTGGMKPVSTEMLDALPNLEMIAVPAAGYSGIDLEEAKRRRLTVTNVPALNFEDVADAAIGMLICLARGLLQGHKRVISGDWTLGHLRPTKSLSKTHIGIVGMGSIGSAIARRLEAFGCAVRWWGPRAKDIALPRAADLAELARKSDILILCAPANAQTERMVDATILKLLGNQGFLINVGRGALVDETALIQALKSRSIAGAALDVFETEPTPSGKWAGLDNVLVTPHHAGVTFESIAAMFDATADDISRFLDNQPLPHALTAPDRL